MSDELREEVAEAIGGALMDEKLTPWQRPSELPEDWNERVDRVADAAIAAVDAHALPPEPSEEAIQPEPETSDEHGKRVSLGGFCNAAGQWLWTWEDGWIGPASSEGEPSKPSVKQRMRRRIRNYQAMLKKE